MNNARMVGNVRVEPSLTYAAPVFEGLLIVGKEKRSTSLCCSIFAKSQFVNGLGAWLLVLVSWRRYASFSEIWDIPNGLVRGIGRHVAILRGPAATHVFGHRFLRPSRLVRCDRWVTSDRIEETRLLLRGKNLPTCPMPPGQDAGKHWCQTGAEDLFGQSRRSTTVPHNIAT